MPRDRRARSRRGNQVTCSAYARFFRAFLESPGRPAVAPVAVSSVWSWRSASRAHPRLPQAAAQAGPARPAQAPHSPTSRRPTSSARTSRCRRSNVPLDADGAKVLVVKFNDYQCPPCRQSFYDYKPILAKYTAQAGEVRAQALPARAGVQRAPSAGICTRRRARRPRRWSWRSRRERPISSRNGSLPTSRR